MVSINADISQMTRFARDAHRLRPELDKRMRKAMKEAGDLVKDDARARTDSVKVQRTLRTNVSANAVTIRAGNARTPLPVLLEGDGTGGTGGEWRHPLFGDRRRWYSQERHPYLHPALEAKKRDAVEILSNAAYAAAIEVLGADR